MILLTGYDWGEEREETAQAEVDSILSKPLLTDTLIRCVQEILSRREKNVKIDQTDVQDKPASSGLAGCLVLVVEDMEFNAEILMDLLEMEDIRAPCMPRTGRSLCTCSQSIQRDITTRSLWISICL